MEELKLVALILKRCHAQGFVRSFLAAFFVIAGLLVVCDPGISSYGDSLWLCFNVVTTIGLGDYTVTTLAARVLVMGLALYGIFIFALIPAVVVFFYLEKVNLEKDRTLGEFYDQLVHADTLDHEQKQAIARKVRRWRR